MPPFDRLYPCLAVLALVLPSSCGGLPSDVPTDPVAAVVAPNLVGIPDRGLDPSAVAVTNARGELCSGVMIASDVVLTARRCVMLDAVLDPCNALEIGPLPTVDPATLQVSTQVGGSTAATVASGVAILSSSDPAACGVDVAIVILTSPLDGATPTVVSESGIAEGGHVRAVGLTLVSPTETVREHATVLAVSASEFAIEEATCLGASGSPAYDETTGEVVGVLSRWGTLCGSSLQFDVFTRVDAFYGLVQAGLAWGPTLAASALDGGVRSIDAGRKRDAGRSKKPPTDVGAACLLPTDCGTGVCVTAEGSEYCSRSCAPADNCPTGFKCVIAAGGESVCVRS
jgi:hypothetical protein